MNTLLTRISGVFEISSPLIPKEDLIHMYLVYPLQRPHLHAVSVFAWKQRFLLRFGLPASIRIRWKRRSTKTHLFKNSLQSGGFLKMPICCIRVHRWNRRFLITITSRCWIPLCAYSNQCVFVWKGKDDSKTQLKRREFFWKRRKTTNPFSDKKGYLWKGTNFTTKRSSTIAGAWK